VRILHRGQCAIRQRSGIGGCGYDEGGEEVGLVNCVLERGKSSLSDCSRLGIPTQMKLAELELE
jgi:hypothetical protein